MAEVKAIIGKMTFEREGKEPLHGFMRVDRGMVYRPRIWRASDTRVSSSPPDFIARLLLSELEKASRREADQKADGREENGS